MIREAELKQMISANSLKVVFLVETDTQAVQEEKDYQLPGFKTLVQNKVDSSTPTRIICLIDNKMISSVVIRMDLTDKLFPSLWLEIDNPTGKNVICGGYYREWAPGGDKSVPAQVKAMQLFTNQIERAVSEDKTVLIMGDANLCSDKWDSPTFLHKQVAEELKDTLTQCGLKLLSLGTTYTADRLNANNQEITSALDHIYITDSDVMKISVQKLDNSATDHLPILAGFLMEKSAKPKLNHSSRPPVMKRSMKDFNKTRWIDALRNQDWSAVTSLQDIEEKTESFTSKINSALDDCAPYKSFKPRNNFRPGITTKAKQLIIERDRTRKEVSKASREDKPALKIKYKHLRNRVLNQLRMDTMQQNGERISKAENEGETWRVVNEILKPRVPTVITITTPEGETSNEEKVAETFNKFFVEKINTLKSNIDPSLIKDPLERIKTKVQNKNLNFSLKPVTVRAVEKIMKKMSKKKSKGRDGISQECLLLGQETLAAPLTNIINQSIATGIFPTQWKEAVVVPLLKKGDKKDLKNYRPVSCLAAASKVLEKVVCEQLTSFVEVHNILPNNQHGFRQGRSTMTALTAMQKEWVRNSEQGLMTGVLVWDLSSAFDTLDIELFLKKMALYGARDLTVLWFRSFLSGRIQRVRVGEAVSSPLELVSGVPQGGILSPIVFTIYTADMELWLKTSSLFNFADDTTTDNKSKDKDEIKTRLEEDANNVLEFMASNGLVANQGKTEFLLLNEKTSTGPPLTEILVGNSTIQRTSHTKLLGIQIEESQEWDEHLKSLKSSLNQRLFVLRRVANQIPKSKLMGIVHSLWISKLRYGLQLCTKVQQSSEERKPALMKTLQLTQNRLLRSLNRTRVCDKVSTQIMLDKFQLLSVNQLAAEIKLLEVWKSINVEGSPIDLDPYHQHSSTYHLRPKSDRVFDDSSKLALSKSSFNIDAARVWNLAPMSVRNAVSLPEAKKNTKKYCKSLPI